MSDATILVVEDEAIVAANIEMRLQSLGYNVPVIVDTGDEALKSIANSHPDLVLMDIRISGSLDGIATAEIIRALYAIPVIYLTAYTDDETLQRARQTEPYGYILKPFEVSELRTAIELALFRHQSERQRRVHEQWIATTLHSIRDSVVTVDTDGRVTFANPAAEWLLGIDMPDAVGTLIDDLLSLVDELTGLPLPPLHSWLPKADGSLIQAIIVTSAAPIPVEGHAAPIYDERGMLLGSVIVLRDLRERRAIESRLKLIEVAVQQTNEALFLVSANPGTQGPRISFANKAFTRITGYESAGVLGETPLFLFGPATSPLLKDQIQRSFQDGMPAHSEGLIYRRDGQVLQAEWIVTPLRETPDQITHWVVVLRDVTTQRRDQEIRNQRQKLESLGVLAGGIAHDFNNLLAVVLGNASMALLDLPEDAPLRELIVPIESAARRAAALTRQMLAYAGHDHLRAQSLDLNNLVRETIEGLVGSTHIELHTRLEPGLPLLFADVAQIRRVLRNLVSNAAEALTEQTGTILVSTSLRIMSREDIAATYLAPSVPAGEYVCLAVKDNGIGMDGDVLARLFEPFFTTRFAGRGLGMAEVLGIVSAHQGTIKVESMVEHGTIVTIALPVGGQSIVSDQILTNPSQLSYIELHDTLLVVSVDQPAIDGMIQTLEQAHYAVLQADDDAATLERLQDYDSEIVAVLIDAELRVSRMQNLLREMRQRFPGICRILLSTRNGAVPAELAPLANSIILRPCSPDELRLGVQRALQSH